MKKTTLIALAFSSCVGLCAQSNLIAGGDFDRANWQNYDLPDMWSFSDLKVKLIETASYPGNKGWMYVDVTAAAGGKMRNYRENDDMKMEYNCIKATTPAKYVITFWAKSEENNTIKISNPWYGADGKSSEAWTSPAIQLEGGVWKQYTVYTDVAPAGTASAGLEVLFETSNGIISFDDFVVTTDTENHKAGEILIDGKKVEGETGGQKNDYTKSLIVGGDFDRANWQNYDLPDMWSFSDLKVKLIETASYPGNKGWMYVDVTAAVGGKMRNYRENDDMKMEFNCIKETSPAKYAITFWAKSEKANTIKISTPWYGADGKSGDAWTSPTIQIEGGVWKQYTVFTDVAPAGTAAAGLEVLFESANGVVSFDDFGVCADVENHEAGEILVDGKKVEDAPSDQKNDYTQNLIVGGDFDRANWQNYDWPDMWSFADLKVKLIETASYPGNKGWMYVDVTAAVGGKMRNYRENDDMKMEFNCIQATTPAKYAITFWAKSEESNTIKINTPWYGADGKSADAWTSPAITISGNTWKKYIVFTDVAPEGTAAAGLEVGFESANGVVSFDDFSVCTDVENHKAGEIIVEGDDDNQQPDIPEVTTDNLFQYGDFEEVNPANKKPMGWYLPNAAYFKFSDDVPTASAGKQSLCIYPTASTSITTNVDGVTNILKVEEDETYVLSFWAKGLNANDKFSARFTWYGNDEVVGEPVYVAEEEAFKQEWTLHTYEVKVPWDVNSASFAITFSTDNDYVFFDDITLQKKEATGIASHRTDLAQLAIVKGQLVVSVKEPAKVTVFDVSGKTVYAATVTGNSAISLNKGAYLVKINNQVHKVVIK